MPRFPKCKICGQDVIKTEQEFIQNSTGYFHKKCKEEHSDKRTKDSVKCYYCGEQVATSERVKNDKGYNFHPECLKEQIERKELYDYCCYIWGMKGPGPLIIRQAKLYREKGFTFKGMLMSLKYFYEVQGNDRAKFKGKETIGIIPYIYEEAKLYYIDIEKKKQQLANTAGTKETQTVIIKKERMKTSRPPLYEF